MFSKVNNKQKNKSGKFNWIFAFSLLVFFVFSILFVNNTRMNSIENMKKQAILIADLAAAGVNGEMIKALKVTPEDQELVAFHSLKKRLADYLKLDKDFRFAYLYTMKDGKAYFMVDAEPVTSLDYSPPGQEYVEAGDDEKKPFLSGQSLVYGPTTDRWGTWMTVLSPLSNETGKVFAVLGMDYPAESWDTKIDTIIFKTILELSVVFIFLISIFLVLRKQIKSERKFSSLVKNIPIVVFRCKIDKDWTMVFINDKIEEISGFPASDFVDNSVRTFTSIIHPQDVKYVAEEIQSVLDKKEKYSIEYRIKTKDNRVVWVKEKGEATYNKDGEPIYLDGFILDISKDKENLVEVKNKQEELGKTNKFMVGRELKMIELKKQIKDLEEKLNAK